MHGQYWRTNNTVKTDILTCFPYGSTLIIRRERLTLMDTLLSFRPLNEGFVHSNHTYVSEHFYHKSVFRDLMNLVSNFLPDLRSGQPEALSQVCLLLLLEEN